MLRKILLIGMLGSALVFAQRGGGGGGGRGGGGSIAPQGSFGPINKLDRLNDMLKLNKDQKKELKEIFDAAQKEAKPLNEQLDKARLAVGEAVAANKGAEEVSQAVNAEAALEAEMGVLEMKAFTRFYVTLETDQRQHAAVLYQMMRGLFEGKNWNSD